MKQFSGFKAEKVGGTREILPAGGYVCGILSAKEENGQLVMAIDVAEGDYAGFFRADYDANTNEDKKWRGTYRIWIPKDDGSEMDNWTKRSFGNFIWAIQESNPGYTWDWDEKKLKGKKLGVLYRNKEWEMNGRTGWTTEAAGAVSVDDCRAGKFRLPKDKPLKNRPEEQAAPTFTEEAAGEDDLPF